MNTLWLKIAGILLVVVVAIILISTFTSSDSENPVAETNVEQRTFYDQVEDDKEKFLTEPEPVEEQQPKELDVPVKSPEEKKQTVLYFKPLDEIEKTQAERLLNVAVPGRSIGRLPMTGYNLQVQSCRQIISKWPESWYAYRAKQMLADIPERFWPRYKLTEQELDLSEFTKPRPGTKAFTAEDRP